MTLIQGGTQANYTGTVLEKFILSRLEDHDYIVKCGHELGDAMELARLVGPDLATALKSRLA